MVKYTLYYFSYRDRAEFIRYIFHYANVPFEDHRIPSSREDPICWPVLKKNADGSSARVVLEVDGKMICQSLTIGRYVAKEFGLAGKDNWDAAQIDALADGVYDLFPSLKPVKYCSNDKKAEELAKFKAEGLKTFLDRYEAILKNNGNEWLYGKQISWVDMLVGEWMQRLEHKLDATVLQGHPALKAHSGRIHALAGVKQYAASRPDTSF